MKLKTTTNQKLCNDCRANCFYRFGFELCQQIGIYRPAIDRYYSQLSKCQIATDLVCIFAIALQLTLYCTRYMQTEPTLHAYAIQKIELCKCHNTYYEPIIVVCLQLVYYRINATEERNIEESRNVTDGKAKVSEK